MDAPWGVHSPDPAKSLALLACGGGGRQSGRPLKCPLLHQAGARFMDATEVRTRVDQWEGQGGNSVPAPGLDVMSISFFVD